MSTLTVTDIGKQKLTTLVRWSEGVSYIGLTLSCVLVILGFGWYKKKKGYPPGPYCFPILGYYPFLGKRPTQTLAEVANTFGDVVSINILGENYCFFNTLETIKEVMVKQGEFTTGRPTDRYSIFEDVFGKKSLLASDGIWWKVHHKLITRTFSHLGMGKSFMENKLHRAGDITIKHISELGGKSHDFYEILAHYCSNVTSDFLYSKYFDMDDPVYLKLREEGRSFLTATPNVDSILCGTVFKTMLLTFKRKNYAVLKEKREKSYEIFSRIIEERMDIGTKGEDNDYVDAFLNARDEETRANGIEKFFDLETLTSNLTLLTVGGTEMVATTLYHALNLMVLYPEVQEKVQNEIQKIVGKRRVSLKDTTVLNYTMAVIHEIQRYSCVIPFPAARRALQDLKVGGFNIPKGTVLICNVWKLSREAKHFQNPGEFDPRNFLSPEGKFVKNEANLPFSTGRRICIGFKLAEAELFIGFTTLLQKFHWLPPDSGPLRRDVRETLVRFLLPYEIKAIARP